MIKMQTKEQLVQEVYKVQSQNEKLILKNRELTNEKEQVEALFTVIMPIAEEFSRLNTIQRIFKGIGLAIQIVTYLIKYKESKDESNK